MRETDKSADTKHKYDDILDCPHHVSSVHPSMPLIDRAAQFGSVLSIDRIRRGREGRSKTYRTESRTG